MPWLFGHHSSIKIDMFQIQILPNEPSIATPSNPEAYVAKHRESALMSLWSAECLTWVIWATAISD